MLQALGNIFQIPELRQKIVFTLIMFAVFRMGTHIPVPGVDPTAIEQLFAQGTLFGLLDLFSGGAFSKFSVFAMSITPYINAAIIIQLLNVVVPTLEQWSKEGAEGQKSRAGGGVRSGFEGGQMPLYRRLPKRGFKNIWAKTFAEVNVGSLNCFEDGATVDPVALIEAGILKNVRDGVRILGDGELTAKNLTVRAQGFPQSAAEKIAAAGGKVEVV